jgi:U32 family peptidase
VKPELLAPAGSVEKLEYAYRYGADAAYIGVGSYSLRARSETVDATDAQKIAAVKGDRKLYGAVNSVFHDEDLAAIDADLERIASYPFDALIVTDPGAISLFQRRLPGLALHLSTQANCVNSESAKFYRDLGIARIILGRELTLEQIGRIRAGVPDVELEVFVHGAMCIAYSGRCYLSRDLAGRSANEGDCAHACRWEYRLEEAKRPGEYLPVDPGEKYTTIFSSKDLCMFDSMRRVVETGVDACKIEGRMKSIYYTAITTAAYRAAIDAVCGGKDVDLAQAKRELLMVSHREFSTGFFFDDPESVAPTHSEYLRESTFLGTVGPRDSEGLFLLDIKNQIRSGESIEYVSPGLTVCADSTFELVDSSGSILSKGDHGKPVRLRTSQPIETGTILRRAHRDSRDETSRGASPRTRGTIRG